MANAKKQYTVRLNEHELGELMMAVAATRNTYREQAGDAPHLGQRIERLEQVYGILKQALELNFVEPGDTGKPN